MNCPYCAEEIKDEAIVCRFCKRDLSFHVFNSRLAGLEKRITEVQQHMTMLAAAEDSKPTGTQATISSQSKAPLDWRVLIPGTVVTALINLAAHWIDNHSDLGLYVLPLVLGSALPFAIYLAVGSTYTGILHYFIAGVVQVLVSTGFWHNYSSGLIYNLSIDSLLFLSAGLTRRYFWRAKHDFVRSETSARVAYNLIGRPQTVPVGSSTEDRWKRVSQMTAALAPILTLLGSIVAAYFGYLATVAKAGTK